MQRARLVVFCVLLFVSCFSAYSPNSQSGFKAKKCIGGGYAMELFSVHMHRELVVLYTRFYCFC